MNVIRRTLLLRPTFRLALGRRHNSDIYEPDYLEAMKPKTPLYDTLNIQLKGYDFAVLESYQKFVHRLAKNMDIDVEEGWATPAQDLQITSYKPNSEIVENQYRLKNYHRTVQITDVSTPQLQLLLRALDASIPEGVTVQVVPHEEYHEEVRYIPDLELHTLKQQLEELTTRKK